MIIITANLLYDSLPVRQPWADTTLGCSVHWLLNLTASAGSGECGSVPLVILFLWSWYNERALQPPIIHTVQTDLIEFSKNSMSEPLSMSIKEKLTQNSMVIFTN